MGAVKKIFLNIPGTKHTWARSLKLQMSITVSCFFSFQKTNNSLPFPFSICSKQTEVAVLRFRIYILKWQQIHVYIYIYISKYIWLYLYIFIYICICICCCFKRKIKAHAIFFNPFTVYSSCKWHFCHLSVCWTKRTCPSIELRITKQTEKSKAVLQKVLYNFLDTKIWNSRWENPVKKPLVSD
jgi:hypothetical protein